MKLNQLFFCTLGAAALGLTAAASPYGMCAHLHRMPPEEMSLELADKA